MQTLAELLQASAALHSHLCPRQVLGVRMGLLAGRLLELELPRTDKRLLAIIETDGCAADGITVATGCRIGKRTMRFEDRGKVAATFVDTHTERAVRIAPRSESRALAQEYAPDAANHWQAQLAAYQEIPNPLLFVWQPVALTTAVQTLVGAEGVRVQCDVCGEEIINGRQVAHQDRIVCRSCAGDVYYLALPAVTLSPTPGTTI
ncbi:MAG: TraR/DksA C4-type zinc finger protein [Anaerolineae bacterium]|nr:TraR/DksA C4-type zinc finger protein [Anaerolineae bacterium]